MFTDRRGVLVVEDDHDVRTSMGEALREAGFHVVEEENGRDAIDVLRAGYRPAVIVLDLMMPIMDGYEFKQHVDADPELSRIPIIIVTASGRVGALERECEVLKKPFTADDLVFLVSKYMVTS